MKKRRPWLIPVIIVAAAAVIALLIAVFFFAFVSDYYHAESAASDALVTDSVIVEKTEYGWYFDGKSESDALIFYPGAKVEAASYAVFLHLLAQEGMDVCLVEMPYNLAFFGINDAEKIIDIYDYENWYIGGHSLGGSMAALYAASNPDKLKGVILCASYPTRKLDDCLMELSIYGSEDKVLNLENVADSRKYAPQDYTEYVIEGGNHAGFGNYGEQAGDGKALITSDEQQRTAVSKILEAVGLNLAGNDTDK